MKQFTRQLSIVISLFFLQTGCYKHFAESPFSYNESSHVDSSRVSLPKSAQHVSKDMAKAPHVEPVIAVNPKDSNQIVVASMVIGDPVGNRLSSWRVDVLRTSDGGKRWERVALPKAPKEISKGDPWLVWGEGQDVYLSCVAAISINSRIKVKTNVLKSRDGGKTWIIKSLTGLVERESHDHPVITFNRKEKYPLTAFMTAGNGFALSAMDADLNNQKPFAKYDPKNNDNNNFGSGVSFSDKLKVFTYFTFFSGKRAIWAISTDDAGKTYRSSKITGDLLPYGFPMLARDASDSKFRNRIYSVWSKSLKKGTDVMLSYSDDYGRSWSAEKKVNGGISRSSSKLRPFVHVNNKGSCSGIVE